MARANMSRGTRISPPILLQPAPVDFRISVLKYFEDTKFTIENRENRLRMPLVFFSLYSTLMRLTLSLLLFFIIITVNLIIFIIVVIHRLAFYLLSIRIYCNVYVYLLYFFKLIW